MVEIDLAPLPGEPAALPPRPRASAPAAQAPQNGFRAWWRRFPSTPSLWVLLVLLTGVGAFLRYWRLDFQAYWTDEAHTLARMQGTFSAMLLNVGGQKFPPGWYAMLRWWCELWAQHLAHGDPAKLSAATGLAAEPSITRALSALFGTLTVPAMYFLARQFTDRKGALLVMLLAAVNPFLIYYSRDIKMYAPLYFFVTLNTAILFQWMTSRRHVIWMPLYVLTGFLMMSVDFIGGCVLGLHLLFLLTRPRPRAWDAALWVIAAGLIAWFPYYFHQNYMTDRDDPSHLDWVTHYTDMNVHTLMSLPTAHVLGYLWPEYPPTPKINSWFDLDYGQVNNPDEAPPAYIDGSPGFDHNLATRSWPWMARWQLYCGYGLFGVLLLGLIPWRGFRKDYERLGSSTRGRWWWVALWIALPMLGFAATWIDENSRLFPYAVTFWIDWLHQNDLPKKIWEPRYLGFIVPAWLLWVGASARRLPFWPVRTVVILALTGVCAFSSLSNHLIYRNAPFNRVAATVMRYYDPQHPSAMVVAVPQVAFPQPAGEASMEMARAAAGTSRNGTAFSWSFLRSPSLDINWLNVEHNAAQVKTLLLVDRDGDDVDPEITDAAIAKRLGPRWKLVDEEKFQWHYEWRFYIFHTWRLRVWQTNP